MKGLLTRCPNCGELGPHFVPPSMGEPGFYHCQREEIVAAPAPPSPQHDTMSDTQTVRTLLTDEEFNQAAETLVEVLRKKRPAMLALTKISFHVAALSESRDAWKEYAEHREWCLTCQGDSMPMRSITCPEGGRLRAAAEGEGK